MTRGAPSHLHTDVEAPQPHSGFQTQGWLVDKSPTLPRKYLSFASIPKVSGKNCRAKSQGQAPKLSSGLILGDSDGLDTDRGPRLQWEWNSGWGAVGAMYVSMERQLLK